MSGQRRIATLVTTAAAVALLAGAVGLYRGCSAMVAPPRALRPTAWAQPVAGPGLGNCFRVSEGLYRGAQPTSEGMRHLAGMGVGTVVSLRSFHGESDDVAAAGMAYEHLFMKAWHPEEEEIVRFLRIVASARNGPVFVHCRHGADRTGTMCAVYRIAVQGWSIEEALAEMTEGGFGFHEVFGNLPEFLRRLDWDRIRREAMLPASQPASRATEPAASASAPTQP